MYRERKALVPLLAVVGITVLTLSERALGLSATAKLPEEVDTSISFALSLGHKRFTRDVLPSYASSRISNSSGIINISPSLVLGPFEVVMLADAGSNPSAPGADIFLGIQPR